jgi:hypothetical protein
MTLLERDNGRRTGMGGHQSSRMGKDEWITPRYIIDALGGWESCDQAGARLSVYQIQQAAVVGHD